MIWLINISTPKNLYFNFQKRFTRDFQYGVGKSGKHGFFLIGYAIFFIINRLQRKTNRNKCLLINHPYTKRLATDKKRRGVSLVLLETSKRSITLNP